MTRERLILSLSFLFAFLMWVPQKLTKNYRHTIPIKVSVDLPSDREFAEEIIKYFPIEIEGKGSKLFNLTGDIKTDTLYMSLKDRYLESTFSADEIISYLRSRYSIPQEIIIRPSLSQLSFSFDSVQIKSVAIQSKFSASFKAGFGQVGTPFLSPDKITITGPHEIVSKIASISTADFQFNNLSVTTTAEISLVPPVENASIKLSTNKISVTINVDEMVEQELIVPVSAYQSEGKTWDLFPNQLLVRLSIPLQHVQLINVKGVKLKLQNQGSQAVSVEVVEVPQHSTYINHSPKILRYFEQQIDTLK